MRCRQQYFKRAKIADLNDLRSSGWSPNTDGITGFHAYTPVPLRVFILDILPGGKPSNHSTQCGVLWVSSSLPRQFDHLKSLNRITSLTLDRVTITLFDFPALRHTFRDLIPTIKSLDLLYPRACPDSLLLFITTFKNLNATTIHAPSWVKPDKRTSHTHTGQLQGTLRLSEFDDDSHSLLSLLQLHATGIEMIKISKCRFYDPRPLQKLLSSARRTIRSIQIIVDTNGECVQLSPPYPP